MTKTGPKGPRAKIRRVLLIEGHPDCLYRDKTEVYYSMTWKDRTYPLGKCGEELPKAIREMNTYAGINRKEKVFRRAVSLPGSIRASVRKVGKNTHILVSAISDDDLVTEIDKVKDLLSTKDLGITERCRWICDYDPGSKGKKTTEQQQEQQPTPYPTDYDLKTGRVNCATHKKAMLLPRDCDVCLMKKHCSIYTEMKEKMTDLQQERR